MKLGCKIALVVVPCLFIVFVLPFLWRVHKHSQHYQAIEREGKLRAKITVVEAPKTLSPHAKGQCKLEVKNLGTTTWTAAECFKLGGFERGLVLNRIDPARLGPGRIVIPKDIKPEQTWQVSFDLEAPEKPDKYRLHLQMIRELPDVSPGVVAPGNTWFGDEVTITVHVR
jgi:hypothetical protein